MMLSVCLAATYLFSITAGAFVTPDGVYVEVEDSGIPSVRQRQIEAREINGVFPAVGEWPAIDGSYVAVYKLDNDPRCPNTIGIMANLALGDNNETYVPNGSIYEDGVACAGEGGIVSVDLQHFLSNETKIAYNEAEVKSRIERNKFAYLLAPTFRESRIAFDIMETGEGGVTKNRVCGRNTYKDDTFLFSIRGGANNFVQLGRRGQPLEQIDFPAGVKGLFMLGSDSRICVYHANTRSMIDPVTSIPLTDLPITDPPATTESVATAPATTETSEVTSSAPIVTTTVSLPDATSPSTVGRDVPTALPIVSSTVAGASTAVVDMPTIPSETTQVSDVSSTVPDAETIPVATTALPDVTTALPVESSTTRARDLGTTTETLALVLETEVDPLTTVAPDRTTAVPAQTTAISDQTTASPIQTTASPDQTTASPDQTSVVEVTTPTKSVTISSSPVASTTRTVAPTTSTVALATTSRTTAENGDKNLVESPEATDDGDSVCFPASAIVELESGVMKRMEDVAVGDRVLTSIGTYSEVFGFTHKLSSSESYRSFVRLSIGGGENVLLATSRHYIYLNGELKAAGEAQVGDVVTLGNGMTAQVSHVGKEMAYGLYNPQTMVGDIVVNGVVASTYTRAVEAKVAHAGLALARAAYSWLGLYTTFFEGGSVWTTVLPAGAVVVE